MKKMMIMAGLIIVANASAMLTKTISKGARLNFLQKTVQQRSCSIATDDFNRTYTLYRAVRENDIELENLLLAKGVTLDEQDVDNIMGSSDPNKDYIPGLSKPQYPVSKKFESIHEMFQLKKEAYPTNRALEKFYADEKEWQKTLLYYAIRDNDIDVIQLALARGADVNEKNHIGFPFVLEARSLEVLQLLQNNGADIHVEREGFWRHSGGNFLHIIMQDRLKDNHLFEYILTQNMDIRSLNSEGGNLWHSLVCGFGNALGDDEFNILLDRALLLHIWEIDPHHKDKDGKSAIDRVYDWMQKPCCGDCYKRELRNYKKLLAIMRHENKNMEEGNRE